MSIFTLRKLTDVRGVIPFSMLEVDGVCQFEEFVEEIRRDGNMEKQLVRAVYYMNQVANLMRLDHTMFRDITPKKEGVKEFEIKTRDLRIYMIKEAGHIVVFAGKKNTQAGDIARFRSIKRRYLQFKSTTK